MALPGDYEHVAVLGEGAFARVTHYRVNGRDVAVKQLQKIHQANEDYQARLQREIAILRELADCNEVIDLLAEFEDPLSYAMPLAATNLLIYVRTRNTMLDDVQRIALFEPVLNAVAAAHAKKILHRDLAPTNILLFEVATEQPLVRVSDFGLGLTVDEVSRHTNSSVSGYGHALYVAPEQLQKLKDATERSDVYALGKLLQFIFTGRNPSGAPSCKFSTLIRRATQEEPAARYASADDLREHFESLKQLYLGAELPLTLDGLAELKPPIDWDECHQVLASSSYKGHPYHSYLAPVVEFLTERDDRVRDYCGTVGPAISEFIDAFSDAVDACSGTVGWPFSASNSFGDVLYRLLREVRDPMLQAKCFEGLWSIGVVGDQWAVQGLIRRVFKQNLLAPQALEAAAEYVIEVGRPARPPDLVTDSPAGPVRRALRQLEARANER